MRIMAKTIHSCLTICLASLLVICVGCNSSEELLYPQADKLVQNKGNIRFIDDVNLSPSNNRQIKIVSGDRNMAQSGLSDEILDKYASMIGLMPRAMSNYILYKFIDDWYGVKYCYGGGDKTGIDCSAFVQKVYEDVFCTNLVRTARDQFHSCKMIWDIDNLIEGDLVFFKTKGKRITHVGIYLANNFFVHASTTGGVMISSLKESYWSKRYAGAGKIPKGTGEKQVL